MAPLVVLILLVVAMLVVAVFGADTRPRADSAPERWIARPHDR
jgi:hypothetical protein